MRKVANAGATSYEVCYKRGAGVFFFLVLVLFLKHPGITYHQGLCLEPKRLYLFQPTKKGKKPNKIKKKPLRQNKTS